VDCPQAKLLNYVLANYFEKYNNELHNYNNATNNAHSQNITILFGVYNKNTKI